MAQEAGRSTEEHWHLVTMSQGSGMGERPHATIVLKTNGSEKRAESQGDGPVDATFKAIESIAKSGAELLLFSVNAVTTGTESQGEVTVRLAKGGRASCGFLKVLQALFGETEKSDVSNHIGSLLR